MTDVITVRYDEDGYLVLGREGSIFPDYRLGPDRNMESVRGAVHNLSLDLWGDDE